MKKEYKVSRKVYLYDNEMNFIREFETTQECADFFEKEKDYINHHLKYREKIRKDGVWYRIKRIRVDLLKEEK